MKTEKLYKITTINGTDWQTGKIKYEVGKVAEAPDWKKTKEYGKGLHLVDNVNKIKDITGIKIPCRIFEVKIIGKDYVKFDDKIKCKKLKVIRELKPSEFNFKDVKFIDNSTAGLLANSTAELYTNSTAGLFANSKAYLFANSKAYLFANSTAELYDNSTARLYDNSTAELFDNSVVYVYSENAIIIPKSVSCAVIVPYERVMTFKKSQLRKSYQIKKGKLTQKNEN